MGPTPSLGAYLRESLLGSVYNAAMKTVYVESTVISYYVARRTRDIIVAAHQEITCQWWDRALGLLEPYVSQIVYG